MKSSKPLRGFTGSRRYTLPGALPLPHPVTAALAAGRLTHALCLEAPSPALLRDTAISLAGALLCRKGGAAMCGDCPACRKVLVGEHPDLMLYDPEENKDIYKKDSVRDLRADLYRTPVEAARKVAILQLAERLPAEGQNLLLKIIEEPPADTFFIFTVQNRYRLLPTVLSRVTCYALPPAIASPASISSAAAYRFWMAGSLSRAAPVSGMPPHRSRARFSSSSVWPGASSLIRRRQSSAPAGGRA